MTLGKRHRFGQLLERNPSLDLDAHRAFDEPRPESPARQPARHLHGEEAETERRLAPAAPSRPSAIRPVGLDAPSCETSYTCVVGHFDERALASDFEGIN